MDPSSILREETRALLVAATGGETVDTARARAFARAALELDAVGRAALAVLDGGLFTGARLLELAAAILEKHDDDRKANGAPDE